MAGQRGVTEGTQLRKKAGSLFVQMYTSPSACWGPSEGMENFLGLVLWERHPRFSGLPGGMKTVVWMLRDRRHGEGSQKIIDVESYPLSSSNYHNKFHNLGYCLLSADIFTMNMTALIR